MRHEVFSKPWHAKPGARSELLGRRSRTVQPDIDPKLRRGLRIGVLISLTSWVGIILAVRALI